MITYFIYFFKGYRRSRALLFIADLNFCCAASQARGKKVPTVQTRKRLHPTELLGERGP